MKIKKIKNKPISSIIKNNLYSNGIIVSRKLFELLNCSQFEGYRTTDGLFMKIGATLSREEFYIYKLKNRKDTLLSELSKELTYEEYLKMREYTTAHLIPQDYVNEQEIKDRNYFILDVNSQGKLYIIGQYVDESKKYPIILQDCGFFKQDHYEDEDVVLQAGGIRLSNSICGEICISGCTFCDYSQNFNEYTDSILSKEREEHIINSIKQYITHADIKTLFITGGNPNLLDIEKWTDFLEKSISTFKEKIPNGLVDVMLTPRGFDKYVYDDVDRYKEYKRYLMYLKKIGVNTISPNMELWEQKDLEKFCKPSKEEINIGMTKSEIGHTGYMDFIRAGIEVFGKYNVRTSLIVGLNSVSSVKEAIKTLIPLGCQVVLSPFKSPNENFNKFVPKDHELIELSNYLNTEINNLLSTLSPMVAETYKKRIYNSLNAHNSHNTANLCCGQDLDFIEQKNLRLGKNIDISTTIDMENER